MKFSGKVRSDRGTTRFNFGSNRLNDDAMLKLIVIIRHLLTRDLAQTLVKELLSDSTARLFPTIFIYIVSIGGHAKIRKKVVEPSFLNGSA